MNRVAIVSGGTGNVGGAVRTRLIESGWKVALIGHKQPPDTDGDTLGLVADLSSPMDAAHAVRATVERFGRLDGAVMGAGGFTMGPVGLDVEPLRAQFEINLVTAWTLASAAAEAMKHGGSLVFVGAKPALSSPANMAAYAASKAGVLRLMEAMAIELAPKSIRANAVLPVTLDTPQNRAAMPTAERAGWVLPSVLADVVEFLLSERALGISGASLPVFGMP